jgi:hypothetical protein
MNLDNLNLISLSDKEINETEGGAIAPIVVGVLVVGGSLVTGVLVGVLVSYAVYSIFK